MLLSQPCTLFKTMSVSIEKKKQKFTQGIDRSSWRADDFDLNNLKTHTIDQINVLRKREEKNM